MNDASVHHFPINEVKPALERNLVQFVRKPEFITGIQVTKVNIHDVAQWCKGVVIDHDTNHFILVPVINPKTHTASRAYIGAWVVQTDKGVFRVYRSKDLNRGFERID